ncbi:unnamed protein product [Lampetra fluviatilis]
MGGASCLMQQQGNEIHAQPRPRVQGRCWDASAPQQAAHKRHKERIEAGLSRAGAQGDGGGRRRAAPRAPLASPLATPLVTPLASWPEPCRRVRPGPRRHPRRCPRHLPGLRFATRALEGAPRGPASRGGGSGRCLKSPPFVDSRRLLLSSGWH